MTRRVFAQFCDASRLATPANLHHELTHEARCCLARYRQVHGSTFAELGLLFCVSPSTASTAHADVLMFFLLMDPFGASPTMLNRELTLQEVKVVIT